MKRMWVRNKSFPLFAAGLGILGVAHVIATSFYLYWTYLWLDNPMHALGGAVVALGFLVCFESYARGDFWRGLFATLTAVMLVGALWEVFEYVTMIAGPEPGYVGDTILDLIMDFTGACLGYLAARAIHQPAERSPA
jgi:hypothetical protein